MCVRSHFGSRGLEWLSYHLLPQNRNEPAEIAIAGIGDAIVSIKYFETLDGGQRTEELRVEDEE